MPSLTLHDVMQIMPAFLVTKFTRKIKNSRVPEVNKEGRIVYYAAEVQNFLFEEML